MKDIAIFTISSMNYFAFAKTMLDSVKSVHSDADLFYVLADDVEGAFGDSDSFETISAKTLEIPEFAKFAFAYSIIEFNTAIKPFVFNRLLALGYKKVVYIDPDIFVYQRLDVALDALDNHSIVVTPHQLAPVNNINSTIPYLQWEQSALQTGVYNLGFLGVANGDEGRSFIEWWANRCQHLCFDSKDSGIFVDQKWIDLVNCYFPSVHVLRHKGYNMSVWNLHDRTLKDGLVNEEVPLVFYHFSSIDITDLSIVSKHDRSVNLKGRPDLEKIFHGYRNAIMANGYEEYAQHPYAYGAYSSGNEISLFDRRMFLAVAEDCQDPFQLSGRQLFNVLKSKQRANQVRRERDLNFTAKIKSKVVRLVSVLFEPYLFSRLQRVYARERAINYGSFLDGV